MALSQFTLKAMMPRLPLNALSYGLVLSMVGLPSVRIRYFRNSATRKIE